MGELYDILKASGLRGSSGGGSGFAPTQEQLDAMNSGIDSAKVEQIEANKNNISKFLPTAFITPVINPTWKPYITIVYGGYVKIGNLVLVSMRFNVDVTIGLGSNIFQNLPKAVNMSALSNGQAFGNMTILGVTGTTNPNVIIARSDENGCAISYASSNSAPLQVGTYVMSGMYLCDNA